MRLLFDFFPILLFFITYKFFGIYAATSMAIVASVAQVAIHWLKHRHFDKMHLITLGLIVVLGSATLILHDELFIKWKPTAINWFFAIMFLMRQLLSNKPLIQDLMEGNVNLPKPIWAKLNMSWVIFFTLLGFANLYVVYNFDTDTWVNFKLFGIMGLTILFIIIQSFFLARHIKPQESTSSD